MHQFFFTSDHDSNKGHPYQCIQLKPAKNCTSNDDCLQPEENTTAKFRPTAGSQCSDVLQPEEGAVLEDTDPVVPEIQHVQPKHAPEQQRRNVDDVIGAEVAEMWQMGLKFQRWHSKLSL